MPYVHRFVGRCLDSLVAILLAVVGLIAAPTVSAATLPSGFTETRIATGLSSPTAMAFAPDGRLFVAEQTGQLRIIKNSALLVTPFLAVNVSSDGERGLLGIAFDPAFASNGFVYVYYTTATAPIHNRVSRFTASNASPDTAAAGSEVVILDLPALSSATNHNGGAIHFGPDGMLYIAVGENGTPSNAPLLTTPFGKLLRIRSDGTFPPDNPFVSQTSGINQAIWARGLRNPFNFAFNPANGRLHVNDVGQSTWEEVNLGIAGVDYGWPATEGPDPAGAAGVTYPIYAYDNDGYHCAIVGAAFYAPATFNFPSEYAGRYFFGDYCGGFIRMLSPPNYSTATEFATGISSLVEVQVSPDGMLYYLARGGGDVFRVQYSVGTPPAITDPPHNVTIAVGQSATFNVAATGTGPLQYQWQRNGTDIVGAMSTTFTLTNATSADSGATFRAVVSNSFGTATSNSATLTVTSNAAPVGTITSPANGTLYRGGEVIAFSGTATDTEDGALPASAFTWTVDFHHDDHTHPFMQPTTGITNGTFTIANRGETSANVFYRVILTVTDSAGLSHTSFVDVRPRTSQITLSSNPQGLRMTLDGQPITAPLTFTGVQGVIRSIGVVSPQALNGTTYQFANWSDAGAATHEISTPQADTIYTATFIVAPSTVVFRDDFETDRGWLLTAGANSARTGRWQRGHPQASSQNGIPLQLGACDAGSVNCLITGLAAGNNAGANDVDGGQTSIQSPPITLPGSGRVTLNFRYYFAHLNNASSSDYFRVRVVLGNGTVQTLFQEVGSRNNDPAAWVGQTADLSGLIGQTIRLQFEAADSGSSSLIEAGVDNVVITQQ
jgi:glucose/arabinose dehydrogenase